MTALPAGKTIWHSESSAKNICNLVVALRKSDWPVSPGLWRSHIVSFPERNTADSLLSYKFTALLTKLANTHP